VNTRFNEKWKKIVICICLAAGTFAAYEPMRHNSFVKYDDNKYLVRNPNVTSGITRDSVIWAFTKPYASNWHPLTWFSHMLDCRLFGLNPFWHHLVSLLLHITNAILLFWILLKMTGSTWASAFVAAVFALHPLQVESVAWAAERKTVLSGFFWFLTIAVYVWYTKRPGISRYMLLFGVYALCIMTKPVVVTLPLVLLLLDYWPLGRLKLGIQSESKEVSLRRLLIEKAPLLVLASILCAMTLIAQQEKGAVATLEVLPLRYRIANMFISYIMYIIKIIWPSRLAVLYPYFSANLQMDVAALCALSFIVISAFAVYIGRRRRYVATGWLWYVGTLVPMVGLVQAGSQTMADRYMYVSMLGLLIIVAWLFKDIISKRPRLRVVAALLAVVALSSAIILTRIQVRYWESGRTLFEHTLKVTKNNPIAENNYGAVLLREGQDSEALPHLLNAVRLDPTYFKARQQLGLVYLKQGKLNEAIACFEESLRQNNKFTEAHYDLALALGMQKKYDDAVKHLAAALALDSNYPEAHNTLGFIYLKQGKLNEAIACFEESLRQNNKFTEAHYNLALALGMQKKYDDAVKHLAVVLALDSSYPDARNTLGRIYLKQGKNNEAIECFTKLLPLKKNMEELHYNLAAAFSQQGKYDESIKHFSAVLDMNSNYLDAREKMGNVLLAAGKTDEGIAYLNEVLPNSADKWNIYSNLGTAYLLQGKTELAIQSWKKAVKIKPDDVRNLNNLAWLLATRDNVSTEDINKSIEFAQHACELTEYKKPQFLDTLAAAYAAAGKFPDAIVAAEKALNAARAEGKEDMARDIQSHLECYQTSQPYREK
jgi:tetratricopeptide (TPR) repeat protein